jgi:hypothetical protein
MGSRLAHFNPILANLQIGKSSLLIIGEGRSGTTWIGQTFSQSPDVLYYVEPCNPDNNEHGNPTAWTNYVSPGERDWYYEHYLKSAFQGLISPGQTWSRQNFRRRLYPGYRFVIKEVATFMSLEWVYHNFDPNVLVVLRHPCGVALSNLERNAHLEEQSRLKLLKQNTALVSAHLKPYMETIEKAQTPLEVSSVIWAIRNRVFADIYEQHSNWHLLYYEDLCESPKSTFRSLFERFDIPWSEAVDQFITQKTSSEEPGTFSTGRITQKQIDKWRRRLSSDEVGQVYSMVAPFNLPFYHSDTVWSL